VIRITVYISSIKQLRWITAVIWAQLTHPAACVYDTR